MLFVFIKVTIASYYFVKNQFDFTKPWKRMNI